MTVQLVYTDGNDGLRESVSHWKSAFLYLKNGHGARVGETGIVLLQAKARGARCAAVLLADGC